MSYGGTCGRCGGLHYGSNRCPYLDEAVCATCGGKIEADAGCDYEVHPNRKFSPLGEVHHSSCPAPIRKAVSNLIPNADQEVAWEGDALVKALHDARVYLKALMLLASEAYPLVRKQKVEYFINEARKEIEAEGKAK